VGLAGKLKNLPRQMSGGEQQRVAIARALMMEPRFLFADEPTGNLDSVNGEKIIEFIKSVNKEKKMTVVMVTHDLEFSKKASRQVHLADGKVVG
jgi:predicted ABC-type transport system involved in lysophospholipase L1 biosynthesis ATPase subunit